MFRAVTFAGAPYVLRELQPTADRLNLVVAAAHPAEFCDAVHNMGKLAAWSVLRATGRGGSASADDLIAFAAEKDLTPKILAAARAMAEITLTDWKDFRQSYKPPAEVQPVKPRKKLVKAAI